MSKELINEIESKIAWNDINIDETTISLRDVKRLLNELEELEEIRKMYSRLVKDYGELYEQNEKLKNDIGTYKGIIEQNKRYREILLYVREIDCVDWNKEELAEIARKALEVD